MTEEFQRTPYTICNDTTVPVSYTRPYYRVAHELLLISRSAESGAGLI